MMIEQSFERVCRQVQHNERSFRYDTTTTSNVGVGQRISEGHKVVLGVKRWRRFLQQYARSLRVQMQYITLHHTYIQYTGYYQPC
jgi:hypothetical protein